MNFKKLFQSESEVEIAKKKCFTGLLDWEGMKKERVEREAAEKEEAATRKFEYLSPRPSVNVTPMLMSR
jgi:hypothetical protein